MYVKDLKKIYSKCQYGEIGKNGSLGYDDHFVSIQDRYYENSISAHPPSTLVYDTGSNYNNFICEVALNDTSHESSSADFFIYADNTLVACCVNVRAKENPRKINANINFCKKITLKIRTNNPLFCHAVWIDPIVENAKIQNIACMGDISIEDENLNLFSDICIASCITPDYIDYAKVLLESIKLNCNLTNYKIVLFAININDEIIKLAETFECILIKCNFINRGFFFKTVVYSVAKVFDANKYLLIDIDTAIQKPIDHIFDSLNSLSEKSILIAREAMTHETYSIGKALTKNEWPYFGTELDENLLKLKSTDLNFNYICNGGVIFGQKTAILALDDMIRSLMPGAKIWEKSNPNVPWREQGILNLALARINSISQLHHTYNYQLLHENFDLHKDATIVHFNGEQGKRKFNRYKLEKYDEHNSFKYSDLVHKYNNLNNNDFDIINYFNIEFFNFIEPFDFEKIGIINDNFGIYACKYFDYNKNIYVFEMNSNLRNFKFYDFFDYKNLNIIYDPDKSVSNYHDFDFLIIECHESEQKTLSQFLIYKDILNENGRLFIVDSPIYKNPYIKERIKDKDYEIIEHNTFFEVILKKENLDA